MTKTHSSSLFDSYINRQQHMRVILQKLNSLLYSGFFLEYVHDCLGGLKIALVGLDRQSFCCKSRHISLVILRIDLASLCDNQSTKRPQLRPFVNVKLIKWEQLTSLWLPTNSPSNPIEASVVLVRPINKLAIMVGNSASYPIYSR